MTADHPVGRLGAGRRDVGDRNTRGVGREDGVVGGRRREFREHRFLDRQVLGDGFDDEVHARDGRRRIERVADAVTNRVRIGVQQPLRDEELEGVVDAGACVVEVRLAVIDERHARAVAGKLECEAVSHRPGADDGDGRRRRCRGRRHAHTVDGGGYKSQFRRGGDGCQPTASGPRH